MELIIERKEEKLQTIEAGDVVVITFSFKEKGESYLAVKHSALNEGRLVLISLNGLGTQGTIRNDDETLEEFLTKHNRRYEVFKKNEHTLTLTKRGR